MRLFEWVPSWEITKLIGGSRTVALAGLFPFVGYLVVANEGLLEWFYLVVDNFSNAEQQRARSMERVREIYFALVWLSVGVILYKLSCPKEISSFQSRYEFFDQEVKISEPLRLKAYQKSVSEPSIQKVFWGKELKAAVSEMKKIKLDDLVASSGSFPDIEGKAKSKSTWLNESGMEISLCLNTYYDIQNYSRGVLRIVTLVAFGVGYVKLSLPAYNVLMMLVSNK